MEEDTYTYTYTGGSFEVTDGDYFAEIPIMFKLTLAPGQDPVHLEVAGKILSVWIASEFGKDVYMIGKYN